MRSPHCQIAAKQTITAPAYEPTCDLGIAGLAARWTVRSTAMRAIRSCHRDGFSSPRRLPYRS